MAAACTATGSLVSFFAITRGGSDQDGGGAGGAGGASAAACEDSGRDQEGRGGAALEHVALVQCRTTRETMANCVRFGRFNGQVGPGGAARRAHGRWGCSPAPRACASCHRRPSMLPAP
jgi:hypothetical protein